MIVRKVWRRGGNNQLILTIPRDNEDNIKEGDYVIIRKLKIKESDENEDENENN